MQLNSTRHPERDDDQVDPRPPEPVAELAAPLDESQRITLLDVVRGFAILGLALVKAADFSPDFWVAWPSAIDRGIAWFEENLLAFKFFTLFTLLFGIGFSVQLRRATARGTAFPRYYLRRSLVLLGIGLGHGLLLWSGDILTAYAIVSFALLLFRDVSNRKLLIAAGLAWLAGHAVGILRTDILHIPPPAWPDQAVVTPLLSAGPPLEIVRYQAGVTLSNLWQGITGATWLRVVLCPFLLGLYLERTGIVSRMARDRGFCHRGLVIAGVTAVIAWLLFVQLWSIWPAGELPIARRLVVGVLWQLKTFGLSATYALLLALLLRRRGTILVSGFAAVGRTALSNYLLQSVVFVLLYYSYGLGLYGRITPLPAMLLSATVYTGQVLLSVWWLRGHRFGPVEWAWRSLTYGRKQPLRRS